MARRETTGRGGARARAKPRRPARAAAAQQAAKPARAAAGAEAAEPLSAYRAKRRFEVTPEPRGPAARATRARGAAALKFVVHKHRASHLHYDLRLEWNGVLLSWAVPRGPSLDPSVKRLAMQTEDHPIDYDAFEGVIPAGEYGGGTMMIWDRGVWVPESPDVDRALARGELKFRLEGEKLRGSFVLVRTRGMGGDDRDGRSWLLIKHRDEGASEEEVVDTRPRSVASGRLLAEIAFDEGGDPMAAATGDPEHALRELMAELAQRRGPTGKAGAAGAVGKAGAGRRRSARGAAARGGR